jgi:hypothetical protein
VSCGNASGNFGLGLHPDKTRLIEFGRFAAPNRQRRGQGMPETFDFLGFTHYCARKRHPSLTPVPHRRVRRGALGKCGRPGSLRRRSSDPLGAAPRAISGPAREPGDAVRNGRPPAAPTRGPRPAFDWPAPRPALKLCEWG